MHQQKLGVIWETQRTLLIDRFGVSALGFLNDADDEHGMIADHMVHVIARFKTMPDLLHFFELERTLQGWFENKLDLLPVETVSGDAAKIIWL